MPNMDWAALSRESKQKLGTYGEYFAKMELASYGLDVYTSEVDDRGIDFVCLKDKRVLKIQVKSAQVTTGYVFMKKRHFDIEDRDLYLFLLLFEQNRLPEPYLIPATAWQTESALLKDHPTYDEPEYAVNISKRNMPLLEPYRLEETLNRL